LVPAPPHTPYRWVSFGGILISHPRQRGFVFVFVFNLKCPCYQMISASFHFLTTVVQNSLIFNGLISP
jgi:hypothetical protein